MDHLARFAGLNVTDHNYPATSYTIYEGNEELLLDDGSVIRLICNGRGCKYEQISSPIRKIKMYHAIGNVQYPIVYKKEVINAIHQPDDLLKYMTN